MLLFLISRTSLILRKQCLLATAVALLVPLSAISATRPKGVVLKPSDSFERSAGRSRIACGRVAGRWLAGVKTSAGIFISNNEKIKALKKDLKKARTSRTRATVRKAVTKAEKKAKREAPFCRAGPGGTPTPTPTAGPTPPPGATPTRTPTPAPTSRNCYNNAGDTTCFGIPGSNVGNISRGQVLFQSFCTGCHSEYRNREYPQIVNAFSSISQMNAYSGLSSAQVSDLAAFLNRYNPNQ